MENKEISTKENEEKENFQKNMPMNEETARYLMNLAQKANLTVTATATTTIKNNDDKKLKNFETIIKPKIEIPKKDNKDQQQQPIAAVPTNPFAALPVSLIKNGILSVTSDTACVEIENGVAILKESHENLQLPTTTTTPQKDTITIEAVHKSSTNGNVVAQTMSSITNSKTSQRSQRTPANAAVAVNVAAAAAAVNVATENFTNFTELQRKILLERHILKTLMRSNESTTLMPLSKLIPNTNQTEFSALLGLEIVTEFCHNQISKEKPSIKAPLVSSFCIQCGTDFSPRWHHRNSDALKTYCERCFFVIILRSQLMEQRIKQLQKEIALLQKQFKLPSPMPVSVQFHIPKLPIQTPVTNIEAQQLFKKYLINLINGEKNSNNNNNDNNRIVELTKLGASIAINSEVEKSLENMKSLNSNASAQMRAKAVQDLQFAFYKGLNEGFQNLELDSQQQQQHSLLQHYQKIVAQMAQKADLNETQNSGNSSNSVESPLAIFERSINQQHQRLIKMIQNLSN